MGSTNISLSKDREWSFPENVSTTIEHEINKKLDLYVPLILTITGTISNILVVMVMNSKLFRHNSTSFYMKVNAIVDTSSLVVALPTHWLYVNFPWLFLKIPNSHLMCKFLNFFGWGTSDLGIILTVAMTTERAIVVMLPLRAHTLCTTRRAKFAVFVVTGIVVIKDLHFLATSQVVAGGEEECYCEVNTNDPVYAFVWTKVWPWIHNAFLLLSFTIISISNVIILKQVNNSNKRFKRFGQKHARTASRLVSRSRQLSVMLVIDSFTIVIFTLPFSVIVTVMSSGYIRGDTDVGKLLFAVSFYLLYVNRCANFYLYCISGSRFREVLKNILCCRSSVFTGPGTVWTWESSTVTGHFHVSPPPSPLSMSICNISAGVSMNPSGMK